MSVIGLKATTSSIFCAHIEENTVNFYKYNTPEIYIYKQKSGRTIKTKYHTHKSVPYLTECVSDLIQSIEVSKIMVKKAESSTLMQTGLTDAMRHLLHLEGAMLALGGALNIASEHCFKQHAAHIDANLFNYQLPAFLERFGLISTDTVSNQDATHAVEAAAAAYLATRS